jgi:phosphatidylserine/phosphatidylglycerophosphate/cardiolipin synthase-like enzyme
MAKFLTTSAIASEIENIIRKAQTKLYLVTPYLRISKNFIERLQDADRRGVRTVLIYGKKELEHDQAPLLQSLQKIELFFYQDLHAKCYFNEGSMIITSLNLHEYSERNNREMGVLILKNEDPQLFNDALQEVESIRGRAERVHLNLHGVEKLNGRAFCIRCHESLKYEPGRPFCEKCYFVWVAYGDPTFPEKFCHSCGNPSTTSMEKPECINCYRLHSH